MSSFGKRCVSRAIALFAASMMIISGCSKNDVTADVSNTAASVNADSQGGNGSFSDKYANGESGENASDSANADNSAGSDSASRGAGTEEAAEPLAILEDNYPRVYLEHSEFKNYWGDTLVKYIDFKLDTLSLDTESSEKYPHLAKSLEYLNGSAREGDKQLWQDKSGMIKEPESASRCPVYLHEREYSLRRADGNIFSFLMKLRKYEDGYDAMTTQLGITYDMESGEVMGLDQFVLDENALKDKLVKRILEDSVTWMGQDYAELNGITQDEAETELLETLNVVEKSKGLQFTVDPYGLTFHFSSFDFWDFPFSSTVFFAEDTDGTIFNAKYCSELDNWAMEVAYADEISYGINKDGKVKKASISEEYEEDEVIAFCINEDYSVPTDGSAYDPRAFLVHTKGSTFFMTDYASSTLGALDLIAFEDADQNPYLSARVNGNLTALPDEETDFSYLDSCPVQIPVNPLDFKVTPRNKTGWVSYGIAATGDLVKGDKSEALPESDFSESTYAGEKEAYAAVLEYYLGTQNGTYTYEDFENMSLRTGLMGAGWPYGAGFDENVGYCLYDIDDNGVDELMITYYDYIYDIYTFDGEKTSCIYTVPYRGEARLYSDGMIYQLFGSNSGASDTWLKMDGTINRLLTVAVHEYSPKDGGKNSSEYYTVCTDEQLPEIYKFYQETGNIPVWIDERNEDITKKEFENYGSKGTKVELTGIVKLVDYKGL